MSPAARGTRRRMDTADVDLAVTRDLWIGLGPWLLGLVVVGGLVLAFWFGLRRTEREPGPPDPRDQPRPPEHPRGYEEERREPDELEPDSRRRLPQNLHGGTPTSRPARSQKRPTWHRGGSSHGTG